MVKGSSRRATAGLCALLLAFASFALAGQAAAPTAVGTTVNGDASGASSSDAATGTAPEGTAAPTAAPSDSGSLLQPEAPSSLFQASLGGTSADAELLVKGTWEASLLGTLDLQSESGAPLGFAGTQPLLFTQSPELYLKFLLFKRFYVEARVSDDVSQALYAVGYQGGEGELLQEIRLGNSNISFPQLPFLTFGEGSYRSFGAMARIDTGDFEGRAMVRYDQADRVTKHFVGTAEVTDTVIAANAFITGKYFATSNVPGGGITGLAVYVQSVNGTLIGGDATYRRMDSSEYSYSALTGLVTLNSAATTRVAIHYTGITPDDSVTIDGVPCDLVYYPDGRNGADLIPERQVLCRYLSSTDASSSTVFVRNTASGLKDTNYRTRIDASGFVEVTYQEHSNPQDVSDFYRQPFSATMPWLYTTDFSSTATKTYAPVFDHEIVVRTYGTSGYITVDKNLVPGSVQVLRNGAPEYAFSVDTENGRLILASPPGLAEEITVTYLLETSERRAGSLVAGLGGLWNPSKDQSMWTALGLRWSIPGSSYATGGLSNPGTVTFTAGEKKGGGNFQHDAALAATYTQEEASGRYRMEGMESDSGYITGFRPSGAWTGALEQVVDTSLASSFPTITRELHADGSTQLALRVQGPLAAADLNISKVETLPPYQSFKTFSFFVNTAKGPTSTATLTLSIDDGSVGHNFLSVQVPFAELSIGWNKIIVHYGIGDTRVYHQASEGGSIIPFLSSTAAPNQSYGQASRVYLSTAGLAADEIFWVDEVLLEDSVGVAAANFQGSLAYTDPKFRLGAWKMPLLSGVALKADASGGWSTDSFASGGGSAATTLGPLGVALHARGSASQSADPSLRGGHELSFPSFSSPVKLDDKFDFDPATGSFGREDTVSLTAGRISALSLFQRSAWSPGSDSLDGLLAQDWKGSLSFGGGLLSTELDASNRATPPTLATGGDGYGAAWISDFAYALPSHESESELRSERLGVKLGLGPDAQIASASVGTSAQPQSLTAAGTGLRQDSLTARLSAPLSFKGLKVGPYYQRSWSDQRDGSADGLVGDGALALSDLDSVPLLYDSVPFSELWDDASRSRFTSQSSVNGQSLPSAAYTPEAGVLLSREFGSAWYDLVTPSALSFAFRRELTRSDSVVSDAGVWDATAKFAAINLFGTQGAYPLGLPFDSDEYYSTIQTTISRYRGESVDRVSFQSQHLATLYRGESDSLSAENRVTVTTEPSEKQWSEYLRVDLTRRVARSWLLSLYQLVVPGHPAATPAGPVGSGEPAPDAPAPSGLSIASLYLQDIARRTPNLRSTLEFSLSLSDTTTDALAPPLTWEFSESYISKLTVPERLTLSAKSALTQQRDGTTGIMLFEITLGLDLTISF